jgi:HemY protein
MLLRRVLVLAVLAAVVVAAATIADYPGSVDITWQGWEIDTSVSVLIAALAIATLALWLLFALTARLARLPGRFRRNRRERRRRNGEIALTRGMIALAAGDAASAQRHAGRAEALLARSPLTLLLAAQAAQLAGDEAAARGRYTALLDEKDGEFLALRGLIGQAMKAGDSEEALRLSRRAIGLRPNAQWLFETLFALEIEAGRWEAARDVLDGAARRHLLPAARAVHHRAVIFHELSLAAETAGERRRAASLAASAAAAAPDLVGAAARHARLLIAEGKRRAARRAVERAWGRTPHPELARVWAELGGGAPALELVTWFEKLAAHNPDAAESHVAVAEAALAAQLWGEARRHLGLAMTAAGPDGPPRRLCLLRARLEEGEHPQSGGAREWFDRALAAPSDPAYLCSRCGGESREWEVLCPHCRGFDTLVWRAPASAASAVPALPSAEMLAAPPLPAIPNRLASARQSDR